MADTYKTKADYTILRKRHQNASNGDIFESDYMTISPMEILFSDDQNIINSDSNFKFSYRINNNLQKKHAKSGWVKTADGDEEWNLDDAISGGTISDESKIRIKPNYNSLKDFAYYGSAVELVRGSLNDIIQNFPAELYFTGDKLIDVVNKDTENPVSELDGYLISNDFGINAHVDTINMADVYNPMRYLSLSYSDYNLINGDNVAALTGVTIEIDDASCVDNTNGKTIATATTNDGVKIYTYLREGKYYLYYTDASQKGYRIRPNDAVVDEYFSTIDEFEYVLLNRDSNPLYMAEFDTPYETDKGNFYKKESYIWPSKYNWNPDIESIGYESYVERLINLATFHDEHDSNNIWRSMTHEAIKNLDWTFVRENGDDVEDLSKIDSSRIEIFLQLYGRQFDGLKRYIDNIKYTNQVTYNEKNNLPDYCLTDTVGNSGWDAKPLIATAKSEYYSDILYKNMSRGYSEVEANNNFMRNLKLNSRYILANKGTREGIAALLGLFGIYEGEYEINEHVAVAKGNDSYCHFQDDDTTAFKYPNAEDITFVNLRKSSLLDDYNGDIYEGIAVKEIKTDNGNYVVPWYVNGKHYDSGMYFQSKGGWGKIKSNFYPLDINVDCTPITAFSPSSIEVYEETQNYLKFASDLNAMFNFSNSVIKNGMIAYVTDITDAENYGFTEDGISHYFVLKDKDKSTTHDGWSAVTITDLEQLSTKDAERIAYLESIKESTDGNNSHTGEGDYDDGADYINSLNTIFGGAIENDYLGQFTQADIEKAISGYTFGIDSDVMYVDNKKCWYYGEKAQSGNIITTYEYVDEDGREIPITDSADTLAHLLKNLGSNVPQPGHSYNIKGRCNYYYTWDKQGDDFDSGRSAYTISMSEKWYEKPDSEVYCGYYYLSGSDKYWFTMRPCEMVSAITQENVLEDLGQHWTDGIQMPVNPEGGYEYDEPAANSIINLKNVDIIFYYPFDASGNTFEAYKTDFKKYLLNVVMPYLEQVIPSTSILSYDIMDKKGGTPSPSITNAIGWDSVDVHSVGTIPDIEGVIYTNEDVRDGLDMVDGNNIISII